MLNHVIFKIQFFQNPYFYWDFQYLRYVILC